MTRLPAWALVFCGGALGALVRVLLDHGVETQSVPWDIVLINLAGSAALGWLAGRTSVIGAPWWYPAAGPGFLGGFTTFSALAALQWTSTASGPMAWQVLLVTAVACCLAAAAAWVAGARGASSASGGTPLDQEAAP